jgi:starch synthase
VTRQLLAAVAQRGIQASLVMPLYSSIARDRHGLADTGIELAMPMGYAVEERVVRARIHRAEVVGAAIYFVDAPVYARKAGIYTYTPTEAVRAGNPGLAGKGYYDYFEMNVTLQKAALELIQHLGARPDVIHCQDAHTALIPAMMRAVSRYRHYFRGIGSGITIHNAGPGYNQEVFDVEFARAITELPEQVIQAGLHRGGVYPFVIGGIYAGFVNAVSENYAREIVEVPREDERTGGIGTAFRQRGIRLTGVTNGIDPAEHDPKRPEKMDILAAYDPAAGDLAGKAATRRALIEEINRGAHPDVEIFGTLEDAPGRPLITLIARLTAQKGVDRFIEAASQLLERDADVLFLVLGTGDPRYEQALKDVAQAPRYAGRVALALGFSPSLANRIYAAGDFFVNPADFEPCGLTDYMAQLMGNVPVVHYVGGLLKVQDGVTGYGYEPHTAEALVETLERAIATFRRRPEEHRRIIQQAVETIHQRYTWDKVLEQGYLPLYEQAARSAQTG